MRDARGALPASFLPRSYFVQKFRTRNQQPGREMFHHVTCAVDKSNVRVVSGGHVHVLDSDEITSR